LQAVRVGQVRRVICAAPTYLARCGTPLAPDDLQQHTIIAASGVSPLLEWRLTHGNQSHVVKLQPRLTTTSNESARAAAVAGFGVTRLMSYQVADALQAGSLIAVLQEAEPIVVPVHVVHHEGRHATQKVRAFLDLAIETLRANPALH
jgi:DNA-binding transcriptional LysR family regulator